MDATPLSVARGGIRRYTAELAAALSRQYPEDLYYLMSDQPFDMPENAANLLRGPGPESRADARWWTLGLARHMRQLDIDVFHGTDFAVPYLPLRPSVMTIHDLSPWHAGTAASGRVRHRTPFVIGVATMVITPSEAIRHEVMDRFRIAPGNIVAIPLAASEWFRPVAAAPPHRPYFLCIESADPRKNLRVVQEAWAEVRKQADVDLVVVGAAGTEPVADEALPPLYSGAVAFLYPSLYEGFGLPVLEAMRCGTLVIASKDPAVTEMAGGAVVQVGATDVGAWVEAMTAALSGDRRMEWREKSLQRAAEFSWERTAMMTREVYDEARRLF